MPEPSSPFFWGTSFWLTEKRRLTSLTFKTKDFVANGWNGIEGNIQWEWNPCCGHKWKNAWNVLVISDFEEKNKKEEKSWISFQLLLATSICPRRNSWRQRFQRILTRSIFHKQLEKYKNYKRFISEGTQIWNYTHITGNRWVIRPIEGNPNHSSSYFVVAEN